MTRIVGATAFLQGLPYHEEDLELILSDNLTDEQLVEMTPHMLSVTSLSFNGSTLRFKGAQNFFASPSLANIQSLSFELCIISFGMVERFSKNTHITQLNTLIVKDVPGFDEDSWKDFTHGSSWWSGLRTLYVEDAAFEEEYIYWLVCKHDLSKLTSLTLISELLTDRTARDLVQTQWSDALEHLVIKSPLLTNEGFALLAAHDPFPDAARHHFDELSKQGPLSFEQRFGEVRSLLTRDMSNSTNQQALTHHLHKLLEIEPTRYNVEIVSYLQQHTGLNERVLFLLECDSSKRLLAFQKVLPHVNIELYLASKHAPAFDWLNLADQSICQQIHSISSYEQAISRDEVMALGHSEFMTGLVSFCMYGDITQDAILALFEAPNYQHLEALWLPFTIFTEEMMTSLARSPMCATLKLLQLYDVELHVELLRVLVTAPFEQLRTLRLGGNPFKSEDIVLLSTASWFGALENLHLDYQMYFTKQDFLNVAHLVLNHSKLRIQLSRGQLIEHIGGTPEYTALVEKGRLIAD